MIVEVTGTGTRNKGAELLMVAIRDRLKCFPEIEKIVVDASFGSYEDRMRYGLWYKPNYKKIGRSKFSLKVMPKSMRDSLGIITEGEVEFLLDASGFAFGDQLPLERILGFSKKIEKLANRDVPVILLPQSFGPFKKPGYAEAFKEMTDYCSLIFARDSISLKHIHEVLGDSEKVYQFPDITCLVEPKLDLDRREIDRRLLLVPNKKYVDYNKETIDQKYYISVFSAFIEEGQKRGLNPVLLIHDGADYEIAENIKKISRVQVPIHVEYDPVLLKKYIGESKLVVGSRYHALVSALSQGVPSIATSWSHKYDTLFKEYNIPEFIFKPKWNIIKTLDLVFKKDVGNLVSLADCQKRKVSEMWGIVQKVTAVRCAENDLFKQVYIEQKY